MDYYDECVNTRRSGIALVAFSAASEDILTGIGSRLPSLPIEIDVVLRLHNYDVLASLSFIIHSEP